MLLSAEGLGTNAIMRETDKSKTCVWRWQERFAAEGFDGLLRDKTRRSRIPKLASSIAERIVALTMEAPPGETAHFHFTPTSASWLNAVEGFFATLTKRRLKRGVFRSVIDVQAAINRFLEGHNAQSKPFQWVADPDKIIAAVRRGHQVLDSIH